LIGEWIDAEVIFAIIILNAILGFVQEYKAEKSIESLKNMIVQSATVIRDGHKLRIPSADIIPGDIIEVESGENVPSDARLIESASVTVDESALTGESEPSEKYPGIVPEDTPVGDISNMLFMGTSVLEGRAHAIVVRTGMNTELGKIAKMVEIGEETETPMQLSLDRLGKFFGIASLIICVIIFIAGVLEGRELYEMLLVAISLAVAAIPEGLPATVTIVLALGVQKMAKRKAIIRKLAAVETLGSTNIICSDKTGTLTQNLIMVKKIITPDNEYEVTGSGYSSDGKFLLNGKEIDPVSHKGLILLLNAASLCNNATYEKINDSLNINGDSTEIALLVASAKAGLYKNELEHRQPRVLEIPFSSISKNMVTVNNEMGKNLAYAKGAPEVVLNKCTRAFKNGSEVPLDDTFRNHILNKNEEMAGKGMRVLGIAYKLAREGIPDEESADIGLIFLGLTGMIDPPRAEVKEAISHCKEAGINVSMITGDQKTTAVAIAKELDIFNDGDIVVTGDELAKMSDNEFDERSERIKVYARTSPEQKLRIVDALKKHEKVVAMTGDGVNDAPALKRADIGVSMGVAGTDVARQASDMVLADDNFASIVNAVEEGRGIYDNIRKFVKFLFSSNLGEVLLIFLGILFGLPLPLLAIQILWVNLITDGLPALALSVDPPDKEIMKRKPRKRSEGIITKPMIYDMLLVGLIISIGTLGIFYYYLPDGLDIARTMAFTALVMFQLWNSLNCRSEDRSFFSIGIFSNAYLIIAIIVSLLLQGFILYSPWLEGIFSSYKPGVNDLLTIFLLTSIVFIAIELKKFLMHRIKV
jgi:Ca2+-transporting ATPase